MSVKNPGEIEVREHNCGTDTLGNTEVMVISGNKGGFFNHQPTPRGDNPSAGDVVFGTDGQGDFILIDANGETIYRATNITYTDFPIDLVRKKYTKNGRSKDYEGPIYLFTGDIDIPVELPDVFPNENRLGVSIREGIPGRLCQGTGQKFALEVFNDHICKPINVELEMVNNVTGNRIIDEFTLGSRLRDRNPSERSFEFEFDISDDLGLGTREIIDVNITSDADINPNFNRIFDSQLMEPGEITFQNFSAPSEICPNQGIGGALSARNIGDCAVQLRATVRNTLTGERVTEVTKTIEGGVTEEIEFDEGLDPNLFDRDGLSLEATLEQRRNGRWDTITEQSLDVSLLSPSGDIVG